MDSSRADVGEGFQALSWILNPDRGILCWGFWGAAVPGKSESDELAVDETQMPLGLGATIGT